MYQNQLFFEDFQKVVKVRIVEQKAEANKVAKIAVAPAQTLGDVWMKRIIIKLGLQSMLH